MRLVLAGDEAAGVQVLRALHRARFDIVAVMAPDDPNAVTGASLAGIARASGIRTWPAELAQEASLAERLAREKVDAVLNVHSLYRVHPAALEATRHGWYNLHPGLLPDYAGLCATSWAIYRGEPVHGVTIHRMAPRIDAGPIVYEERFSIEDDDTALTVSTRCTRIGVRLMVALVEALDRDPSSLPLRPQDASALRYFRRDERPIVGSLDWAQPADQVSRTVRAYDYYPLTSPWGYPPARLLEQEIGVIGIGRTGQPAQAAPGTVRPGSNGGILVACADELVAIRRVAIDGRVMAADNLITRADAHWIRMRR